MCNSETGCTISSRVFITLVQWWNGQQTLWKECKTRTSKSWFRCDGAFAKLLTHFWLSDQGEVLKEIFRETTLWSHIRFNSVFFKLPLIYIRSVLKGLKRTIKADQTNIFKTPCTPVLYLYIHNGTHSFLLLGPSAAVKYADLKCQNRPIGGLKKEVTFSVICE